RVGGPILHVGECLGQVLDAANQLEATRNGIAVLALAVSRGTCRIACPLQRSAIVSQRVRALLGRVIQVLDRVHLSLNLVGLRAPLPFLLLRSPELEVGPSAQ